MRAASRITWLVEQARAVLRSLEIIGAILVRPRSAYRQLLASHHKALNCGTAVLLVTVIVAGAGFALYANRSFAPEIATAITRGGLDMDDATVSLARDLLTTWIVLGFVLSCIGLWLVSSLVLHHLLRLCGLRFIDDPPQSHRGQALEGTLSIVAHAQLPIALSSILLTLLYALGSTYMAGSGSGHTLLPWTLLALLPPTLKLAPWVARMVAGVDVFTVWQLALLLIGFCQRRMQSPSRGRRWLLAVLVVLVWLLSSTLHWLVYP